MIAPFRRHLRKWLLGLAVAASNKVQVVVARLEYAEKNKTGEDGRETAPRAAGTAQPVGPPDHWIQMVKRHAPELLQPGPPRVVSRAPEPVSEADAGMTDSFPDNIPGLESGRNPQDDGATPNGEVPTGLYAAPRVPESPLDPAIRRQAHGQNGRKQESNGFIIAGVGSTSPGQGRGEASTTPGAPAGSEQPLPAPEKNERMFPPRTAGLQGPEDPVRFANPMTGSRLAEKTGAAHRHRSTDGQFKRARADARKREDIRALQEIAIEPSDRQGEHGNPKPLAHDAGLAIDARRPFHGKTNQKAADDVQPAAGQTFRDAAIARGAGGGIPAPQTRVSREIAEPDQGARIISGQPTGYSQTESEKTPAPTELSWPSLPGEKDSEDIRDPHLTADWPLLPEEREAAAGPASDRLDQGPTEAEARIRERIRRLDGEQKGKQWSVLHF